jgi:hypothetical protein
MTEADQVALKSVVVEMPLDSPTIPGLVETINTKVFAVLTQVGVSVY